MKGESLDDGIELTANTDPVLDVSKSGFSVDVKTKSGFTFRFHRMAGGYSFDDGYLPDEDPNRDYPNRGWVFATDELPEHVLDALRDAGYSFTGKSASPRATLTEDDTADDTWHDRAERYANASIPKTTPEIGATFEHDETGEQVVVVDHMFEVPSGYVRSSPFVVETSDGERVGHETPNQFHDEYSPVKDSSL